MKQNEFNEFRADQCIEWYDDLIGVDDDPFFYQKLRKRMSDREYKKGRTRVWSLPMLALAASLLIIFFNIAVFFSLFSGEVKKEVDSGEIAYYSQLMASDYPLEMNSFATDISNENQEEN